MVIRADEAAEAVDVRLSGGVEEAEAGDTAEVRGGKVEVADTESPVKVSGGEVVPAVSETAPLLVGERPKK